MFAEIQSYFQLKPMKTINSDIAEITFNEIDSVLSIKIMADIEIDLEKVKKHFELINKITGNKKYIAIVDGANYFHIKDDALRYMASPQATRNRIATAFYSHNLANRLSILCLKLYSPPSTPLQYFSRKENAIDWIQQIKAHENQLDHLIVI